MLLADLSLAFAALVWGFSFIVIKDAFSVFPPSCFVALRFGLAAAILAAVCRRRLRRTTRQEIAGGCAMGIFQGTGNLLQAMGLSLSYAGSVAFISSTPVVLIPLIFWLWKRRFPGLRTLFTALLCLSGVALLTLGDGEFRFRTGDLFTMGAAICFAFNFILMERHVNRPGNDALVLTIFQCAAAGLIGLAVSIVGGEVPTLDGMKGFAGLAYAVIPATVVCVSIQVAAMAWTTSTHSALINTLQAVFGTLFGVLLLNEPFTRTIFTGCALILFSIVLSVISKKNERAL